MPSPPGLGMLQSRHAYPLPRESMPPINVKWTDHEEVDEALLDELKLAARITGDGSHQPGGKAIVKRDRVNGNRPRLQTIIGPIPQPHLLDRIRVELPVR